MRRRGYIGALHLILPLLRWFLPGTTTCRSNSSKHIGCGPALWRRSVGILSLSRSFLAALFVTLALLNATEMDAFLRPASQFPPLLQALQKGPLKVSLVGSGNWGTAVGKIIASNASESYIFNSDIRMWVLDEVYEGRKLSEWVNVLHENRKFLPGCKLPPNLRAVPCLKEACQDADLLVFALPHQFVEKTCQQLAAMRLLPPHARAISLVKGISVRDNFPVPITREIGKLLGLPRPCVLSGANVANDVAQDNFAEATIGHSEDERETAALWQRLFDRPNFKVNVLPDVDGVEVCGALKNVVAVAAGFCDGLGQGTNTKAAILRLGVEEIQVFIMLFFGELLAETLFDSCGYADVITTVFGGRNARVSAEFVKHGGKKSWHVLESEMLNGQKLQGPDTLDMVAKIIKAHNVQHLFPLFMATYAVAFEGAPAERVLNIFRTTKPRSMQHLADCAKLKVPALVEDARARINLGRRRVDSGADDEIEGGPLLQTFNSKDV